MPSRDYDVTLVMSQSSKLSWSETRTRINYPRGPFEQTLKENIVLKHKRIWITTLPVKKHFARPNSNRNSALFITTALLSETKASINYP